MGSPTPVRGRRAMTLAVSFALALIVGGVGQADACAVPSGSSRTATQVIPTISRSAPDPSAGRQHAGRRQATQWLSLIHI